jgi:hypothetical protein
MLVLPWETEQIIEESKGQLQVGQTSAPVIASLISNLKNPTEFALVIVDDDETIAANAAANSTGFLGKMKSLANSATTQAAKMQRQVTAGCNRLAFSYGVRYVIPICPNVECRGTGGSLTLQWTTCESGRTSTVLSDLSNKFINVFNASKEIAMTKSKSEFMPNGHHKTFSWLWKYQPVVPLPSERTRTEASPVKPLSPSDSGKAKIACLSWNVAGLPPPEDNPNSVITGAFSKYKKSLMRLFSGISDVDVVIISLQEASPLNAKTVLFKGSDTNYGEAWLEWFSDVLSSSVSPRGAFEYVRTAGVVQVGLAVAMFVKNTTEKVNSPMTSCVRTGTLGLTGNKGCVGVRTSMTFGHSNISISLLNVHLASGDGKSDFRRTELAKVVNESSFGEDKGLHFFDSQLAIVTGDLNSRIGEGVDTEGEAISSEDELLARMRDEGAGFMFFENPVEFPATYKLVPGEEGRLVFASNRKPGWCDRVLYRSRFIEADSGFSNNKDEKRRFACTKYQSLRDIDLSDHTPVYAFFEIMEASAVLEEDEHSTVPSHSQPGHAAPEIQFGIGESAEQSDDDNDSDLYDQ